MVCALKVIREPGIRRVIAQGGLEPVSRGAPLRDEPANRHPVTRDDDSLAVLDGVEDASEAPRRLSGSHRDHKYILSDLVCLYVSVDSRRLSLPPCIVLGVADPLTMAVATTVAST